MRPNRALVALGLLLALTPVPAAADVTPIQIDPQKEFKHKLSGIVLGASVAGISRTSVVQYDDKQLDVEADFRTPDKSEIVSVYFFRKVTGDVPLWFDRIQRTVEASNMLSSPHVAIPVAPFIPAGQSNARGLRAVYAAGGPPWKSSGAALTTTGEWFVAVRISSKTLSPEQLLGRIDEVFAAIRWPKEKVAEPAAVPISVCATSLEQVPEDAKSVDDPAAILLASAMSATIADSVKTALDARPLRWCRDPLTLPNAGVYRPDGATDRYLVAFQDAGRGIWVAPNGLAGILAGAQGNGDVSYMMELVEIDRHVGYGSFKTLPNIGQAMWTIEHGSQQYVTSTWGKNKTIEINSDTLKE